MIPVNTQNILFICGGAFDGIEKIIERRLQSQSIGYSAHRNQDIFDKGNLYQYVSPADFKKYGLIPELIGRLPAISYLQPLDRVALRSILTEPKNALIKQYQKLFEPEGIQLKFDDNVLDFIVDKAIEFKLGARGLRSICETIMLDLMYELPQVKNKKEHTVTLEYAREKIDKSNLGNLKVA